MVYIAMYVTNDSKMAITKMECSECGHHDEKPFGVPLVGFISFPCDVCKRRTDFVNRK